LDLSGLDQSTWYPVTISIPHSRRTRMRIMVALDSGTVPNWSTHSNGFSVLCDWTSNGNGWGTVPVTRTIHTYTYSFSNVSPVGGISQMTNSSLDVVYLRGGGKYFFEADYPVTPVIQTTSYTTNSQTVSPSTSLINDVFSSANAPVAFGSGTFSGALSASNFSGSSSGTNTGDQTNISGTASNITAYTINQNLGVGNQVTFDSVITGNNGNGTNFRIGDDSWIGDINVANTFRVQGVQNAAAGYICFGNGDTTALGRTGTGALTYGGNTVIHSGNIGSQTVATAGNLTGHAAGYAYADGGTATNLSGGSVNATTGSFSGSVGSTGGSVYAAAGDGNGFYLWGNSLNYSVYMSSAANGTYGGGWNQSGSPASDYNMYFNMTGYARGYAFKNNGAVFAQLIPKTGGSYVGGMLILRDVTNNNGYGIYMDAGVMKVIQVT
jgi:hypothetical protein